MCGSQRVEINSQSLYHIKPVTKSSNALDLLYSAAAKVVVRQVPRPHLLCLIHMTSTHYPKILAF